MAAKIGIESGENIGEMAAKAAKSRWRAESVASYLSSK
jgi:hypothetical protein